MQMTLKPSTRTITPLALTLLGVPAALSSPAQAALPPEVAPLVAKLASVRPSSERFEVGITVRPKRLPKNYAGLRKITLSEKGEATLAPPLEGTVTTTALGRSETIRAIGDTVYVEDRALAAHDGGRPWVVSKSAQSESFPLGVGTAGAAPPFAKLAREIETGRDVKVLGTTTISGQPVTRVSFTLIPSDLVSGKLALAVRKLRHATSRLEVDLNAEGIPLRTAGVIAVGKIRIGLTAELTALDFPLSVAPPASSETITEKEALALLKKKKNGK